MPPKHLIYTHRNPPQAYDANWLATEFANVQRAVKQTTATVAINLKAGVTPDNYPLQAVDQRVTVDATSATYHVDLPKASTASGVTISVKKIDGTANTVVVVPTSPDTIDGGTGDVITTQYNSRTMYSDGTNWWRIATT